MPHDTEAHAIPPLSAPYCRRFLCLQGQYPNGDTALARGMGRSEEGACKEGLARTL